MESDQLRKITIIGIGVLCLSPIEFFSNKLFENKKETKQLISYTDIKLEPNHMSNNYEIFNPNIKTTSEEILTLVSENKKKEKTESENNLESKKANEKTTVETVQKEEKKVVEQKKETSTKTSTTKTEASKKNVTTTNKKVEQAPVQKKVTSTETKKSTETKAAAPDTTVATNLVNYAKQFVGNPYKYGGTDLYNGIDCSGFTMKVYEHFGYSLPHASKSQVNYGSYVSIDSLMPGDLIFYGYNGSVSHVAIYIGDGKIVHATTNTGGIKIGNYKMMPIITARRILK